MDSVVERIMDNEKWPGIEMPENLELLNELADQQYDSGTFSGMLAATLMYHQIIEAMCIHLLEDCHFHIQLALYPATIQFKIDQDRMLGSYIKELKESVDFLNKEQFITSVEEFNKLRNKLIHKMRRTNEADMIPVLREGKQMFDRIFELYDDIQDDFKVVFHCFIEKEGEIHRKRLISYAPDIFTS